MNHLVYHSPIRQPAEITIIDEQVGCQFIGLYIAPEARRSRVGYETMKLLEQYAFGTLNMRLLYAVIRASNGACLALYQSLGYEQIAVLPQWTLESEAYLLVKYNK